ncbi:MAG: YdcF family protein [Desulfobacula sp.]|jgi:uncharacterized SAM-binding protein YcdF (DUF218 family)|nr:YdcF family protein [Desulfobacula sp.]MBT7261573.1 YdcF family protein [Desulfobacula sp.]
MDTLFFWISKLMWIVISPDSLLVILAIVGLALLYIGSYKKAKAFLGIMVFIMVMIAIFPAGEWLLSPLEMRFATNPELPDKIDGIIVLAGGEDPYLSAQWDQVELGGASERNFAFMRFIRQYPDARHVFTGGSGSLKHPQYKSTHVAKKLYSELGIDTSKIVFEELSKNTYESVKLSKTLIKPKGNEKWVLITTSWHMPRSVGIFEKFDWPVIAYPVDHYTDPQDLLRVSLSFSKNLNILKMAVKEWVGLVAYYLTGKTSALLPRPQPPGTQA